METTLREPADGRRPVPALARAALLVALATLPAACAIGTDSPTDEAAVVNAVTAVMTADNNRICVDSRTSGDALAIYRTMMRAPDPSRRPLAWHAPGPLRPVTSLSERQLIDDEFRADRVQLAFPRNETAPLPGLDQMQTDSVARALAGTGGYGDRAVAIAATPRVVSRWWPINRVWPECVSVFTLSNPAIVRDTAFVAVRGAHWGTLYAARKEGTRWTVKAQWTNWLY